MDDEDEAREAVDSLLADLGITREQKDRIGEKVEADLNDLFEIELAKAQRRQAWRNRILRRRS